MRERDARITRELEAAGLAFAAYRDQVYAAAHEVLQDSGKFYTVFTPVSPQMGNGRRGASARADRIAACRAQEIRAGSGDRRVARRSGTGSVRSCVFAAVSARRKRSGSDAARSVRRRAHSRLFRCAQFAVARCDIASLAASARRHDRHSHVRRGGARCARSCRLGNGREHVARRTGVARLLPPSAGERAARRRRAVRRRCEVDCIPRR